MNVVLVIALFTAIPCYMFYKIPNELFQDGISTIAFLVFSLIGVLAWIKLLDHQPLLKINKKGIWIRQSVLPFSPLKFIDWNQIKFVELNLVKGKHSSSTVLVINRNDTPKTKTIDLDNLNYPSEEIIDVVREFSKLLNFRDRINVK